jgi:hypothetical protein
MALKPMVALCSVLLLTGGCSQLIRAPERYASLAPVRPLGKIDDVVIPGTMLKRPSSRHSRAVDPDVELRHSPSLTAEQAALSVEASAIAESANNRPPRNADRTAMPEPDSTASLDNSNRGTTRRNSESRFNPAIMDRLVKAGQAAAKPICTGC